MDVIFETRGEKQFTLEVWFFSTVLEMKEMIQKHHGFPVLKQRLVFNGVAMSDERDTEYYSILQGSRIQLFMESDPSMKSIKVEESQRVTLHVKVPHLKRQFSLEVDLNDTASKLKDKVHELEGAAATMMTTTGRIAVYAGSVELQDNKPLFEYSVSNGTEVSVLLRSNNGSGGAMTTTGAGAKKLKVVLLPMGGKKFVVEVNAGDGVRELRKEVQRRQQAMQFCVLGEEYFFIYKQNVMEEERSFRWHDVRQGDVIEIFNGKVSGGS
ncbi:hypothetical protein QJS10_CPA01g00973 [Acorus calamus]|uniref:Ubiquitin-like domain-containing protein n=1 Tax=Acorus calamus TaxID=4465 RepID=A0AAV9FK49_ACOCL|nr:hypothetical protein QJS10_CPA01g00973 [Acorus calamus]